MSSINIQRTRKGSQDQKSFFVDGSRYTNTLEETRKITKHSPFSDRNITQISMKRKMEPYRTSTMCNPKAVQTRKYNFSENSPIKSLEAMTS